MEIDATFLIFSCRDGSSPPPQLNYFTFYLAYIHFISIYLFMFMFSILRMERKDKTENSFNFIKVQICLLSANWIFFSQAYSID